jgi:periplasmic protein TonB
VQFIFREMMSNIFRNRLDFDDLIFEHRNKEYGAYLLRRRYNFNVLISVLIGSFIISTLVIIPFLKTIGEKKDLSNQRKIRFVEVKMDKMELPKEDIFIPPAPPPPPANSVPNIKYIAPVVVDTVPQNEKPLPSVAEVQASNPSNDQLVAAGPGTSDDLLTGQEGEKSDEPFMIVEVKPTFKGGDIEKFREWVQKKAVYPQIAQDNGIQGKVILTFVVEKDGSVSNIKVVKGVDKILDDEAVKAIQASPKWSPGLQRGRPVRVRFFIPLVFSFSK